MLLNALFCVLEHHAAGFVAAANRCECLAQAPQVFRRIGHERVSKCSRNFIGIDTKKLHGRAIGADEAGVQAFVHVGNRSFVEQIAELLVKMIVFLDKLANRVEQGGPISCLKGMLVRGYRQMIE